MPSGSAKAEMKKRVPEDLQKLQAWMLCLNNILSLDLLLEGLVTGRDLDSQRMHS